MKYQTFDFDVLAFFLYRSAPIEMYASYESCVEVSQPGSHFFFCRAMWLKDNMTTCAPYRMYYWNC